MRIRPLLAAEENFLSECQVSETIAIDISGGFTGASVSSDRTMLSSWVLGSAVSAATTTRETTICDDDHDDESEHLLYYYSSMRLGIRTTRPCL